MNRADLRYCLQKLLTMNLEKKITIIAVISVMLTITLFWLDDDPPYENIFKTIFELLLMTILIFGIITMNFFAISFFVKRIKSLFRRAG
jgi:ABC-type multidrug transport system fused ATPase/permease subunit